MKYLKDLTNYSRDEKIVGKWINGEMLYQKSYELTNLNNEDTIDDTINNTTIEIRNQFGNFRDDANSNYTVSWGCGAWYEYLRLDNTIYKKINKK